MADQPPHATGAQRVLGLLFIVAGALHFVRPQVYARIVPPLLPADVAVLLSGIAEVAGGIGVLLPRTRRSAGWGLLALLLAVWPANIWMALQADQFPALPRWALWLRVPLQLPLMYWVWRSAVVPPTGRARTPDRPRFQSRRS